MAQSPTKPNAKPTHGSLYAYTIGFVISVGLTLIAYAVVQKHLVGEYVSYGARAIILFILGLAVVQLIVQLFFFLHLGREEQPKWNTQMFLYMTLMLLILVIGSIWIMDNLNYNMMPSHDEVNKYMNDQSGL